ncbi:uncharacterized protein LOC110929033 isoform X1 [Helianthus annuus]|uniref:uncharacterized protein LOC110929033 isoform X1 n=1 Tax=Helianthus annuus TaxID=4232 RepID=UPI000B8F9B08|nr:uncharacterized protein LOC110929033 isoform X1 [Helianthus annuus]XP_022027824.1 uncharacterized protein LOC110929033 isoform X1 [Helianthus annuus]
MLLFGVEVEEERDGMKIVEVLKNVIKQTRVYVILLYSLAINGFQAGQTGYPASPVDSAASLVSSVESPSSITNEAGSSEMDENNDYICLRFLLHGDLDLYDFDDQLTSICCRSLHSSSHFCMINRKYIYPYFCYNVANI